MTATDLSLLELPSAAGSWLGRTDAREVILDHRMSVNRKWWAREFADHSRPDTLLDQTISRGELFAIAEDASRSPTGALTLLWNAIAWGSGTSSRNNRTRITAVAASPTAAGELLQRAAQISRHDPQSAYELLLPANKPALKGLGPAFFTKYFYFAGAGAADHPCYILDERVARALYAIGWTSLPTSQWRASAYQRYCDLLQRWAAELHAPRADLIERWLFDDAGHSVPNDSRAK